MTDTMHQYKVGDYASTSPRSDQYPVVVTYVSPSGKTVRVRAVAFRISTLVERYQGKHYDLGDVVLANDEDVEASPYAGKEQTYRYTNRLRGGARFRGPGGTLNAGFCYYQDPSY